MTPAEVFAGQLIADPRRLGIYEIPERGAPGRAAGLLLPRSENQVGELLRRATDARIGLSICAGRTGLVEAQRPLGEVVLSLEKLVQPLFFELADGQRFDMADAADLPAWWQSQGRPEASGARIAVQAGVAVDALNALLEPLGLMWPMEMGSSAAASVGACIANASAGANAVCYGTAAHLCHAASGFWGSGESAGPCAIPAWRRPDSCTLAIDSARLHPEWGLVGTQGAFGLITRAELRLSPRPARREAVLVALDSMEQAMALFEQASTRFGEDVEEFEFIGAAAMYRVCSSFDLRLPHESPGAPFHLLLQIKSTDPAAPLDQQLYEFLAGKLDDARIGYAPLPALKRLRHSITEASNLRLRDCRGGRLSFDTATPVARFGAYLDALQAQLARTAPQIELLAFGHAGVGGAHLHLLGSADAPVAARADELTALVFDLTQAHAGTWSAEHGVGSKWAGEYRRRTQPAQLAQVLARKRACDPANVLNPRSFGFDRLLAE